MTARERLAAYLRWRLPKALGAWRVGRWDRGRLVCRRGRWDRQRWRDDGIALIVQDVDGCDGRWRGWDLVIEDGPLSEGRGDWYHGRGWGWPETIADEALAAVARIGTREVCAACSGTGGGEQSCHWCGGDGVVLIGHGRPT